MEQQHANKKHNKLKKASTTTSSKRDEVIEEGELVGFVEKPLAPNGGETSVRLDDSNSMEFNSSDNENHSSDADPIKNMEETKATYIIQKKNKQNDEWMSPVVNGTTTKHTYKTNVGDDILLSGQKTSQQLFEQVVSVKNDTSNITIVNTRDRDNLLVNLILTPTIVLKVVAAIEAEIRALRSPVFSSYFTEEGTTLLSKQFLVHDKLNDFPNRFNAMTQNLWLSTWNWKTLLENIKYIYQKKPGNQQMELLYLYKQALDTAALQWKLDATTPKGLQLLQDTLINPLNNMYTQLGLIQNENLDQVIEKFFVLIKKDKGPSAEYIRTKLRETLNKHTNDTLTWIIFISFIESIILRMFKKQAEVTEMGMITTQPKSAGYNNNSHRIDYKHNDTNKGFTHKPQHDKSYTPKTDVLTHVCRGCGSNRHKLANCPLSKHPDWNSNHNIEWEHTPQYKQLLNIGKFKWLGMNHRIDGKLRTDSDFLSRSDNINKGKLLLCNLNTNNHMSTNDIFISTFITTGDNKKSFTSLIDSGALHANYCSEKVAEWVNKWQK